MIILDKFLFSLEPDGNLSPDFEFKGSSKIVGYMYCIPDEYIDELRPSAIFLKDPFENADLFLFARLTTQPLLCFLSRIPRFLRKPSSSRDNSSVERSAKAKRKKSTGSWYS
ncbi:MAG: hypothetical protein J5846_07730 [Desulfovibrio sp.]|nr:hypothetical protein [Desulfovibrio sp.]